MAIYQVDNCRHCGSLMMNNEYYPQRFCYTCRKNFYITDELAKLFGPRRVPDLPVDEFGEIIWN